MVSSAKVGEPDPQKPTLSKISTMLKALRLKRAVRPVMQPRGDIQLTRRIFLLMFLF
jgi:hypothetical protein